MPAARHVHIGNLTLGNDRPLAETSLHAEFAKVTTRMTVRLFVIVAALDAILFVLLKLT